MVLEAVMSIFMSNVRAQAQQIWVSNMISLVLHRDALPKLSLIKRKRRAAMDKAWAL